MSSYLLFGLDFYFFKLKKNMKLKGLRWWVVGLVALAAVVNYIDRQAFGALWPEIAKDLFPDMDQDGHKLIFGTISTVCSNYVSCICTRYAKFFNF